MQKIITEPQANLLTFLEKQDQGVSKTTIMRSLGIGDNSCDNLIESLTYRVFISRERNGRTLSYSICITDAGRLALQYFHKPDTYKPVKAPPSRINMLELPEFKPCKHTTQTFCRNDGHRNIRSLGAFA